MKSQVYYLFLLFAFLFSSCQGDKVQGPQLTVSPETVTLKIGETQPLKAEVSHSELTPSFVSLNPRVASVDKEGLVRGVAEGETKEQVVLQDIVRTVSVKVLPGEVVEVANQLPLLLFTNDHHDSRIVEHETRVGRKEEPLVPIDEVTQTVGYANKDLIITTAAYGQVTNEGVAIIAGCSESVALLTETRKMLKEYGFDELELLQDSDRGYYYKGKNDKGIMVVIYRVDLPDNNIQSMIMFVATRFGGKGTKLHDVLPSVQDFPNYIALLKGEATDAEIKANESTLGFRALVDSPQGSLRFNTKQDQLSKTNINMAFYVVTPPEGGSRFIRLEMNCAEKVTDLLKVDFQQYLGVNGFGKPTHVKSKDFVFADCLTDPTVFVAFYVQLAQGDLPPFMLAEISKNQTPKSNMEYALKRASLLRGECKYAQTMRPILVR